ncbi:uncharacterized protein SPSK_03514 [Sporothrix schenckii 1099-18]|uniref:Uncharacterized protein n=1 Tax=Sporothrix schenckii 1099-18 TaxID=1397361 RepID=A0A0F2LYJ6_SPOSC|nr:uncharacterized protein SPSK_03514 [Sporothrix schenckii 1099-18]KJR82537.1 hypothetical protein SPSK_03514 [Sporothrix schenckii 1099-18]
MPSLGSGGSGGCGPRDAEPWLYLDQFSVHFPSSLPQFTSQSSAKGAYGQDKEWVCSVAPAWWTDLPAKVQSAQQVSQSLDQLDKIKEKHSKTSNAEIWLAQRLWRLGSLEPGGRARKTLNGTASKQKEASKHCVPRVSGIGSVILHSENEFTSLRASIFGFLLALLCSKRLKVTRDAENGWLQHEKEDPTEAGLRHRIHDLSILGRCEGDDAP